MQKKAKSFYFIGICGISLSALAQILKSQGRCVAGSDGTLGEMAEKLRQAGIKVIEGHNTTTLDDFDVVVFSAAIAPNNPELLRAKALHKKIYSRAQLLGQFSRHFKNTIAVSGCHGKTTTTAMLSCIFINAGLNPTIHIGGTYDKIGGNVRLGSNNIFITEACEYKDSFLSLKPKVSVILGVQADHLDYFKNVNNVQKSFNNFASNTQKTGFLVFNSDNRRAKQAADFANCKIVGISKSCRSTCRAKNIFHHSNGCFAFDCVQNNKVLGRVYLSVPGEHNITNALAAIAVAIRFNISFSCIQSSLFEFAGVDRRFQLVGQINGAKVFHDYAHHPTEIQASIKTAYQMQAQKVFVVFQPHTYSRTKSFFCRFAKALCVANEAILYPIYPAREAPIKNITSEALSQKINQIGGNSVHYPTFGQIIDHLKRNVSSSDIILILGAGDIVNITKLIPQAGINEL